MTSRAQSRNRGLTLPLQVESKPNDPPQNRWQQFLAALSISKSKTEPQRTTLQTTLDQHQSPLCKLPFELRQMIWKEVLGNGIMHITHLENRLSHARCTDESGNKWGMSTHDCWGKACCVSTYRKYPSLYAGPIYGVEKPQNLLGLMMSCRAL